MKIVESHKITSGKNEWIYQRQTIYCILSHFECHISTVSNCPVSGNYSLEKLVHYIPYSMSKYGVGAHLHDCDNNTMHPKIICQICIFSIIVLTKSSKERWGKYSFFPLVIQIYKLGRAGR